jgi:hypothetical protein
VLSAQTQLLNAQASAINSGVLRATLEHAIAVLVGQAARRLFHRAERIAGTVPVAPTALPRTLLERRPDIAGAERRMAAANAQIGVAIAAYFPDITLTGSFGSQTRRLRQAVSPPPSSGRSAPMSAESMLDFGSRSAQVEQARAAYDQNIASYRQTVLTGFQQVEDELSTLRILEQQASVEVEAVKDGAGGGAPDPEPVQGRHRALQQRHHRPGDRASGRGNRDQRHRKPADRQRDADRGHRRRLGCKDKLPTIRFDQVEDDTISFLHMTSRSRYRPSDQFGRTVPFLLSPHS